MNIDINGMLANYKTRRIPPIIQKADGTYASDSEVRAWLQVGRMNGMDYFCSKDNCSNFDTKNQRCNGHKNANRNE